MAEINCPIYEMKSKKVSLEEIFLELTAADKPISEKSVEADLAASEEKAKSQKNDEGGEK